MPSTCDFLVASYSSTELHTILGAPVISNSPSMPDMNDASLHEVIETLLASGRPGLFHSSRKHFALGQNFRSPVSLALIVLKAQLLALKRRVYILEDDNGSLKLANTILQSKVASLSGDLSIIRADYHTLLRDRKKSTLAAELDQQRIRALTSDIDNAQQFIMAMVDIKLHENFLHVAANEAMDDGEDAEQSLAKAIAQEADREGSLWSRILSFVVDVPTARRYSAAVDLALQAKNMNQLSGVGRKDSKPPHLAHGICQVTRDNRIPSASRSETRYRPPTPFTTSRRQLPTSPTQPSSSGFDVVSNPPGLEIRRIYPTPHSATGIKILHDLKSEAVKPKPTRKKATSETIHGSESPTQSHSKKMDKRKGVILTNEVVIPSISHKVGAKEKTTVFKALSSLERICALLSSSDLGSLEETSDEESRSRASDDSGGSLDVDKGDLMERSEGRFGDDNLDGGKVTDRTVELATPSNTETAENGRSSMICLVSGCHELSPSSTPRSTPLGSASSFFSERVQVADNSPTLTEFSDIRPTLKPEPIVSEDSASIKSSLNLSRLPVVSGIAKRLSRIIMKVEDDGPTQCVSNAGESKGSLSSSVQEYTRLRSGSSTSTITRLKKSLPPKTPKPKSSTKPTALPKKTGTLGQAVRGTLESPASPPSVEKAKDPKPEAAVKTMPILNAPQDSKLSVGRNLLRRLSNIPGSVSRPRFPTTAGSPPSPAGPNRTPIPLASPPRSPTKLQSQAPSDIAPTHKPFIPKAPALTAANGTTASTHTSIGTVNPCRTKPRSNTVNDFSPAKRSPLSQNVITSKSRDSRPSWKRQSVQMVISTHATKVARTPRAARTSDADNTDPPKPAERRPSIKRQGVKNGESNSVAAAPTAAFMKPVDKSATKVAKRMTNSIKPLIPTWNVESTSSSECSNMFRNSLSMIVR